MYAVATFVIVAVISMLFTRLATGALIATGLPPEVAAFQARSAFTGAGFTTVEAENVVNHTVRRRVIATTMLVGNLGTPTLIVTVLIGLIGPGPADTTERLVVTLGSLVVLLVLLSLRPVTRFFVGIGERYAQRRLMPAIGTEPTELFEVGNGYVVAEVGVAEHPELGPRSLRGLDAALPGLKLLGVRRRSGKGLLVEPPEDLDLGAGDSLVVFGSRTRVDDLSVGRATPD
ncbi:MAG: hypothetical protein GY812_04500 [Actinomycetia bacterium]|nr:hypothetical protein [Actinomycetes bacterium]